MASDDDVAGPPESGRAAFEGRSPAPDGPDLRLTSDQIDLLGREGQVRPTVAGEVLFREGDRAYDFIVILAGFATSFRPSGHGAVTG